MRVISSRSTTFTRSRAEALAEERPAAVETEPDPLALLGLAPAPFDVDAT